MDGTPDIYHYSDYRQFLSDYYRARKSASYGFSLRLFARRAGTRSFNYLSLVISGKRNISASMAHKFARGCELHGEDADFFVDLVEYSQASGIEIQSRAYQRLTRYRRFRAARKLDAAQAAYHSAWYLPAIRELVRLETFQADAQWIASQLLPTIPAREARRALNLLHKLALIEALPDGSLRQTEASVTTGQGPLGHHIYAYHHMMLKQAGRALDELDREERDISSVTLAISEAKLVQLKQRLRSLRNELLAEAELDPAPERVVQINFQLFPLSKRPQKLLDVARDRSKS